MTEYYDNKQKSTGKLLDMTLTFLFIDLFRRKSAPQIFVLFVDTLICAMSYLLVVYVNVNTTENVAGVEYSLPVKVLVVTAVYLVINVIIKNYKYTIRLPIIEDMYRTALLVFFSSAILIALVYVVQYVSNVRYFSVWNIVMAGFMSFTLMMCLRLITKHLYSIHVDRVGNSLPVILLGNNISTIALAHMLKNEQPRRYNPLAIISTELEAQKNATVNGFRVLRFDERNIEEIFREFECDSLLVPDNMFESVRNSLSDVFLKHNIKLLMVNHVSEFMQNKGEPSTAHVEHIKIEDLLGRNPIRLDKSPIKGYLADKTVLITGAAGSIGSEITRQIATIGAKKIVLIDQAETPMHSLLLEIWEKFPKSDFKLIISDITDMASMERIFSTYRPDVILHAAAYKHVPMMEYNPIEAIRNNVFGTKIIADLAVKYSVDKFVMVSTDKAVNPTNIMGATKRAAEIYVQSLFYKQDGKRPTQFITTRFGNVLGSNGSVIPLFKQQIENGGPVTVTHRDIIRYFMTIDEACSLVLEASCIGRGGEIFIFDMGTPIRIYDLATKMINLAGLKPGEDIEIKETGLRPGEKLYEELLYDKETSIPTSNKKIMRTNVTKYDFDYVSGILKILQSDIISGDEDESVKELKTLVPEYVSENSQWQKFDKANAKSE